MTSGKGTSVRRIIDRLYKEAKARKALLMVLSCLVVFVTTYILILPAVTLDQEEAARQGGIDVVSTQDADVDAENSEASVEEDDSEKPVASEDASPVDAGLSKEEEKQERDTTDTQNSPQELTAKGKDYTVTVSYDAEANIPDGAELTASELKPGNDEYKKHYSELIDKLEDNNIETNEADQKAEQDLTAMGLELVSPGSEVSVPFVRFFDITILAGGHEIEPSAAVDVSITYDEPISVEENQKAEVIHFAEDGTELIDPMTDLNTGRKDQISTFDFQQDSFSITATVLKYTEGITEGKYVIIKGTKETVNGKTVNHYYAMTSNGSAVEVTKTGDTYSNIPDDCSWRFTKADSGNFYIENDMYYSWLTLYNGVTGNWRQEIIVGPSDGGKTAVYFKNPNGAPLRWNGTNKQFILFNPGDNAESFYLARVNSDIEHGPGDNFKPAGETDLGELYAIRDKINNSKILTDKTASVFDYDNRIYQINLKALSDVTVFLNKVDLELIVDTSRSMYFPATLNPVPNSKFNKISGSDRYSLTEVVKYLDKNQVYYFVGEGEKATVFAMYYAASGTNKNDHSGAEHWRFVDASYMNPPDAASMNQSDTINRLSGRDIEDFGFSINLTENNNTLCRLYTSPDGITRLAYLKEAVRIASEIVYALDRNNQIGLVTFNSTANNPRFYNYNSRNGLYSAINNISLAGGTRQDLGLEKGIDLFNNSGREDAQKIAILITDGAPNMRYANNTQIPSDEAWRMIGEKANILKGDNSSNAKLYTLGLSLNMVGGNNMSHLNGLASEEDNVTRHFNADNGPQIASAVKQLIETLVYDARLEAEVTDVIDPAFYPVDQNGTPIAQGDYYDQDGKKYTWSKEIVNGAECWKVTYYDQNVGRGEKNSDGTIKTPGWQKSIFVKAKEDFLGGNNIETNRYYRTSNRVKPTKYVYTEKGTGIEKKIDAPSNAQWGRFDSTPHVNVDELHLLEQSTEWTVYLGTEVDPAEQLRLLWDDIEFKQVVKDGGTTSDGSMMTGADKMWYSHGTSINEEDEDAPANDAADARLALSHYPELNGQYEALLAAITSGTSYDSGNIPYSPYGHNNVGYLRVTATKTIEPGASAAQANAPEQHKTDKTGAPVERYVITVTYTPSTTGAADSYPNSARPGKITTGTGKDEVKSENEHKINVFAKRLQILKSDQEHATITGAEAEFALYRKATDSELSDNTVNKVTPEGLTGSYVLVQTLTTTNGEVTTDALPLLAGNEPYYLVETEAPTGYSKLTDPLQIRIDMTGHNTWTQKKDGSSSQTKPNPYVLSDWLQEATLLVTDSSGNESSSAVYVLPQGQHDRYNSINDTTDASVTYRIINSSGVELPNAGGPGTTWIYLIGSLLLICCGIALVTRRRMRI